MNTIAEVKQMIESASNILDNGRYDSASVWAQIAIAKVLVNIAESLEKIAERGITTSVSKEGQF